MTDRLDRVRFAPERDLIALLAERYGLDDVLRRFEESGAARPYYELATATQLRLTPLLAPRLTGLLDEVRDTLGFDEPTDLYVHASSEINAFALHSFWEGRPHVVSVTSGLVERMSDVEIRFVLGHELGHLQYRHYRSRLVQVALRDDDDDSRLPALLQRRLETWDRLAELSADRAGFGAVHGDLVATVHAFFKMETGLGPEHLRYDIQAFLAQLEEIARLTRRDVIARFSHPMTPVRVRALQLFHEAGGLQATPAALTRVDAAVFDVAGLMELDVTEPIDVHCRDLLVAASLLAVHVGGRTMTADQSQILQQALLPLAADPEETIRAVGDEAQARALVHTSARWLAENAGEQRYAVFAQVAHVAALDGELPPAEEAFLLDLAERLQIPEKRAKELIYEAVTTYLQQQASSKTPVHVLHPLAR